MPGNWCYSKSVVSEHMYANMCSTTKVIHKYPNVVIML